MITPDSSRIPYAIPIDRMDGRETVPGEHNGEMKLRAVFKRDGVHAPAVLSFDVGEDGQPESHGWARYDGSMASIADMEP